MPSSSSSAQQALQALAERLRHIRIDAGLTGRSLAGSLGWHSSKVSKIEHGKQSPSTDDIRSWCEKCSADDQIGDLIASLRTVKGMFVEWRRMERSGLRLAQESVLPLWKRTRRFRIYSPTLVPGPVQTPGYITAVLTAIMDQRGLPDDVAAAVEVRVAKQAVIHQPGRQFAILIEEGVLRHPIGGAGTMVGQLGHLLAVGSLPSISLGVIPLGVDRSARWPAEAFFLFEDEQVNVELVSGHLTVTQPREVAMYRETFASLAGLAVYGVAARALITAAITALDI